MQGIVLTRVDVRESDQRISVYTKEHGKLELLARGLKKTTSKNSASLEPFSFVDVSVVPGKNGMQHLTKVQRIEYFSLIRSDLQKALMADYVVRLIDALTQRDEADVRVFESLLSWLYFLQDMEDPQPLFVDAYTVVLLNYLGFSPILDRCVLCSRAVNPDTDKHVGLYFAGGGVVCSACQVEKMGTDEEIAPFQGYMSRAFRGFLTERWDIAASMEFSKSELFDLHQLIHEYLEYHSEKPIGDLLTV